MSNAMRLMATVVGLGGLLWATGSTPTANPTSPDPMGQYALSGPYTHDNLSLFLLHGPDTLPPRPVKTLDEALAAGTAVVHETGNVNQLCVENLSADDDLMIQNGDILKGGKQDRVAQLAMILPPKSGKVALPAFCVEQSRWSGRGQEPSGHFAANPGQIAGKDLKLAVNSAGVQGEVWANVAAQQAALSKNVGKPVNGTASPSSLQLALENKALQTKLDGYRAALATTLTGKVRVVGYVLAVNGKVTGAEVFGSRVLLAKAWPKAIDAAAVEALAEKKEGAKFAAATEYTVTAFLADAGREQRVARAETRTHGLLSELTRISTGLESELDTSIEVVRENPITLHSPRVTEDPIGGQVINSRVVMDSLVVLGNPSENIINVGERLDLPGVGLTGPTTVNPTLRGRTAATRDRLVVTNHGRLTGTVAPPATPVQAAPVTVNRTAGKNGVMVESRDRANPGVVIHRTFIAK